MKKAITSLAIFALLIIVLVIPASANQEERGTSTLRSITINTYPDKTVYGAFEQLDTAGLTLRATYSDGSEKILSPTELRISYNRDNCFRVGDDSVILSYEGKSLYLPVTVNRIAYDISALNLSAFTTIYNGRFQSYSTFNSRVVGLDGIPLTVNAVGGGINAGVYDISIDFSTLSSDYLTPESRVVKMTIEPAKAEIVWSDLSFTYDGKSKSPTASYIDVTGSKVYATVNGVATNAGVGYTAIAATNDSNYIFTNTTTSFEIKKADYDFSGVIWSTDSFIYDGSKKSISASGLPSGVSIIGYSGDRGSDAGVYTVTAKLSWDENNYNMPSPLTHEWEIKKADYDLSGIGFKTASFTYDGMMHYPTLVGEMPVGADGIQLEYSFSSGASHVSDGVVSVIISFSTSSKNYNIPENRYSSVSITPLGIEVMWGELFFSYSGEEQAPTAYAEECVITVIGKNTTVGKYTATASTDNSDYYIVNDKVEYSITKAQNNWTITPGDSICYEGREITLTGKSRFGNVTYTFYSDSQGKQVISKPTACGIYYAALSVSATENYDGLRSEIISFEIVEIAPVSFYANIIREGLCAFDIVTEKDFACSVINNDGSTSWVDSALVKVIYENGDSLRKRDNCITLKYDKFTITLPITVGYANYDLSGVEWKYTSAVYDGKAKTPLVFGLPEGVRVVEYVGSGVINAGGYKVTAVVSYDKENYNEPKLPVCDFVIEKRTISIPLITAVYNGSPLTPKPDSSIYTVTSTDQYTNAGRYSVSVKLTDSDNYVFAENMSDSANAIFEILPATIGIKVFDIKLHLFEPLGDVPYTITSGITYGDDVVNVSGYLDGRKVFVRSDNPNYSFDVEAGRLVRLPYPTAKGALLILVVCLSITLLAAVAWIVFRNRRRLAGAGAALKCRWHNRNYKAPLPKPIENTIFTGPIFENEFFKEAEPAEEGFNDSEPAVESNDFEEEIKGFNIIDFDVDAERADMLITDSLAKSLLKKQGDIVYTDGSERCIINVDTLSENFSSGDIIDINSLKAKGLVPDDIAYVKLLARGKIDKPLTVYANEFSLSAIKMIALTGGQAIKSVTKSKREKG